MKVRYTPRAARQLVEIFDYLNERSPAGATRVLGQMRSAERIIAAFPFAAPATDELGIRRLSVATCPYVIFYEVTGDEVVVHRIRHAARRPLGRTR